MADMVQFEQAVDQVIEDSERLHKVVNGTSAETVITEDGSTIPTVRKALLDNLYYKTPPLPWVTGTASTVFNQLYAFYGSNGVQWWYAPGATASMPITLPPDPSVSVNWKLYNDASAMASQYAPINSPVLTGNPQAPTPPANSNSTTIATTAFVVRAVTDAIQGIFSGTPVFVNISVTGTGSFQNLTVAGTSTFNGPVNADNVTGRFQNLVLTKQGSTLAFDYTDSANPSFKKSQVGAYVIQTHDLTTDIIVNGTASADNTTISLTGIGNNVFDYVTIKGNGLKPATEPRLVVSGITQVENLNITGTVTGLNFSVDGLDIAPRSVTTTAGVTVGGDLSVAGQFNVANITAQTILATNTLTVTGLSTMNGGFTTGTGNGVIGGNLSVAGSLSVNDLITTGLTVNGPLRVTGLTNLEGGFTTTSSNGVIGGTLTATGLATLNGGITTPGNLTVGGTSAFTGGFTAGAPSFVSSNLSVSGNTSFEGGSGTTTVHNLVINGTVTGLTVDLSGQVINVAGVNSTGPISGQNGLNIIGGSYLESVQAGFLSLASYDVPSPTATWTPDGLSNVYNITVDKALTIAAWAVSEGTAFSAMIYLEQLPPGGFAVTLDPTYGVLNSETVNTAANSVTILQLTYRGVGTLVDTVIVRRL